MHEQICTECRTTYHEDADRCPTCGAPAPEPVSGTENDPTAQLVRTLLYQARQCQLRGDLIIALKYANDALALRPTCSTIHTLLGAIYEQKGDQAAAHHHFQKALTVTPPSHGDDEDCLLPMLPPETPMVRTVSGVWVMPALIACLLFSGLAALFTLWPLDRQVETGNLIKLNNGGFRSARVHPRAPKPASTPESVLPTPAPVTPEPAPVSSAGVGNTAPRNATPIALVEPTPAPAPFDAPALGPSATATMPVVPDSPTMEQADEAFFNGNNERAIAMYEKLLTAQDAPSPRIHQHLAKCYHNLGNTDKARSHLKDAIAGYQALVQSNPKNDAAQDELKSCQSSLDNLNARENPAP